MKKSSAWCMLVPGLVILFLFLMIPLLLYGGRYPDGVFHQPL